MEKFKLYSVLAIIFIAVCILLMRTARSFLRTAAGDVPEDKFVRRTTASIASAAAVAAAASDRRPTNADHYQRWDGRSAPCSTKDLAFDGVPVRIYSNAAKNASDAATDADTRQSTSRGVVGRHPAVIYFHGGGWVHGSIERYEQVMKSLCEHSPSSIVFISVGYRLAPEYVFPIPFDDCLKATKFLLTHGSEFDVDISRVAVMGDSSGANLAAAVALRLRDEHVEPSLRLQLLFYPPLQGLDFQLPSMLDTNNTSLTAMAMCSFTALYLEGSEQNVDKYCSNAHSPASVRKQYIDVDRLPAESRRRYVRPEPKFDLDEQLWNALKDKLLDARYSPLVAASLAGLPKTYMLTVERDCLRDEGLLYVDRLRRAGIDVTHRRELTGPHSSIRAWIKDAATFIRRNL